MTSTPRETQMKHRRHLVAALAAAGITALPLVAAHAAPRPATQRAASPPPAAVSALTAGGRLPEVGTTTLGQHGWTVQSSAVAGDDGAAVSTPSYSTAHWLPVRNDDGNAPGTEIEALLQNGECPNVFYSDRMRQCFGTQKSGQETVPRFAVPWWFRTTFDSPPRGQRASLVVNGVVGEADVWVNGTQVATTATVQGLYTRYTFDVTRLLREHGNAVAIAVHPNNPNTMFTVNNLDWAQVTPDQNTGIHFPVQLRTTPGLALDDVHVVQRDSVDLSTAKLTVVGRVTNATATSQRGTVAALVVPPDGRDPVFVTKDVTVAGGRAVSVRFDATDAAGLTLRHPQVWWPYRMGAQPLYTLVTALTQHGRVIGSTGEHFGIRTVTSRLVGPSPLTPGGVRQYFVNGKPFVVRGGGFSENILLHYDAADTAHQITLLRNLGLNSVRLEGHFMPQDFYDQMDRAGILVASGFQCCNAWELDPDTPLTAKQHQVLALSSTTIARYLRDHPSVFTMQWSDNQPTDEQETIALDAFRAADFDVPVIASAEYKSTKRLGISGEKEGPYDWVPPAYWYDRAHSDYVDDPSLTNVGGAFALDTEQSAGHTIPTPDSQRRFLSPADQHTLWTDPTANQYHANASTGTSGYAFGTLFTFDKALAARYGQWDGIEGYTAAAQLSNYENTRAQFEAFVDHSQDAASPSTGTIYWQVNKGWPTLLWSLYNYDYDTPGAYFGAQEANRSLHALFTVDDDTVTVDNLGGRSAEGLSVESRVYDLAGRLLDHQRATGLTLQPEQVRQRVLSPRLPAGTGAGQPAHTYFVELLLRRDGRTVDRNVYWRSTRPDVVDWDKTVGNPQATMTQYADLTELHSLPAARTRATVHTERSGRTVRTTVTITNTSTTAAAAFFLRADVRRGDSRGRPLAGDNEIRPAAWDGNDITLWPGESQTLTVSYAAADLGRARPVVTVSGWNVPAQALPA